MMMINQIPVLLITGYLGSGKTTLLNRILNNNRGIKFAVIVNDIGEVNIDANLIEKGGVVGQKDESLVALQNGCICCTLKMDLIEQIHDITSMGKFDYIVIEASGICEPEPIAQTICSIPQMGKKYVENGLARLDCIVTVVDALRMRDEFGCGDDLMKRHIGEEDIENLVIQQVEFCNMILLNKAAEVSAEELDRIKKIIRALQPKAEIVECNYGDVDFNKILNTHLFNFEKVVTSATWIRELEGHSEDENENHHHEHEHDENCTCGCHDHDHHHHHHADEVFTSWGMETPKKFSEDALRSILSALQNEEKYGLVLRAKGFVDGGDGEWIYFDYVPGEADIRRGGAAVTGRFCVIGSKLNEQALKELFNA